MLGRSLQDQVFEQADQEVRQESAFVASYLEREGTFILSQLTLEVEEGRLLMGTEKDLAAAMSKLDMASIMRMLGFGSDSPVRIDLVKIVDPDGKTVLELHRDLLTGHRLDDEALIARGLGGSGGGDIITTSDGKSAYLVGAAALEGTSTPAGRTSGGLLILGRKIDRDVLLGAGLSGTRSSLWPTPTSTCQRAWAEARSPALTSTTCRPRIRPCSECWAHWSLS